MGGNVRLAITGAAPIAIDVLNFMRCALGIFFAEGLFLLDSQREYEEKLYFIWTLLAFSNTVLESALNIHKEKKNLVVQEL